MGLVAWTASRWLGGAAEALGANGTMIGLGAAQLVVFLALVYARYLGIPRPVWGSGILAGIGLGLVAVLVAGGVQSGWEILLKYLGHEIVEQPAVSVLRVLNGVELGGLVFMTGLIGPVVEEVYFRYWWMDWLKEKSTAVEAALLVAIVFAFLHGTVEMIPGLFVMALIAAYARLRWGLVAAVACHSVFNITTIILVKGGWL